MNLSHFISQAGIRFGYLPFLFSNVPPAINPPARPVKYPNRACTDDNPNPRSPNRRFAQRLCPSGHPPNHTRDNGQADCP